MENSGSLNRLEALVQPQRVAVIRLSSMGDIIHTLPATASLKKSFPTSHVSWLVRPRWMPLLEGNPSVDQVISVERSFSAAWSRARELRKTGIDLAIDFQGLIQTAALGIAIRPDLFAGFDSDLARESLASGFYQTRAHSTALHVVDQNLDLAKASGADTIVREFPLPPGSPEGTLPEEPFVLASPFAGWGSKQWPLESWTALVRELPFPLVVNGPPGSEAQLSQITGASIHTSGIAGLIDATRRARAVIGLDSGPMHLAAALGKRGVALFGPTDPARNGPYGNSLTVLRSPNAKTSYSRSTEPDASMREISHTTVRDAVLSAWEAAAA